MSPQWGPEPGFLQDLLGLGLPGHCIIGLRLQGPNFLHKSTLSSVKVKSLLRIDGMTSLDFNFYPGKKKANLKAFMHLMLPILTDSYAVLWKGIIIG